MDELKTSPYEQYVDLYEFYKKNKERESIVFTGCGPNDEGLSIFDGINIISGMTGAGKSTFGYSIAFQALLKGKNVAFINVEIPKQNVFFHMLSILSYYKCLKRDRDIINILKPNDEGISHSYMKKGTLSDEYEKYTFGTLWDEFKHLPGQLYSLSAIEFDTTSPKSLIGRLIEIEELSKKNTGKGIELVIVDYIQMFKKFDNISSEYESYNNWVNYFMKLSNNYIEKDKSIPIILLSQLNRDAWKSESVAKRNEAKNSAAPPTAKKKSTDIYFNLSQVAGSLEIARAANQVFVIYTDESLKMCNQCQIYYLKSRDGQTMDYPVNVSMNCKYSFVGEFEGINRSYNVFDGTLEDIFDTNASETTFCFDEEFVGMD